MLAPLYEKLPTSVALAEAEGKDPWWGMFVTGKAWKKSKTKLTEIGGTASRGLHQVDYRYYCVVR